MQRRSRAHAVRTRGVAPTNDEVSHAILHGEMLRESRVGCDISWLVGGRDAEYANTFMGDVAERLAISVQRTQILGLLVEGCSLRAASRLSGASINTVTKLLMDVGTACEADHDEHVRNLNCQRVQCDEIWSFVYAKQKNIPEHLWGVPSVGDIWTRWQFRLRIANEGHGNDRGRCRCVEVESHSVLVVEANLPYFGAPELFVV